MTTEIDSIPTRPTTPRAVEEQGGEALTPPAEIPASHPAVIAAEIRAGDSPWPPAFAPNAILDRDPDGIDAIWRTVRGWRHQSRTLAGLGHYHGQLRFYRPWRVYMYIPGEDGAPDTVVFGFGQTPREAYRAAHREQRLAAHDTADLLEERAGLRRQVDAALDKIALEAAKSAETRREVGILRGRIASLQAMFAEKPARDPGSAVLSLAYLRAWLDNAPLSEIQRDGLEVLLSLARPWHARGSAWERMLLSVQRLGIQVGVTPQEASRGR